jgi:alkylresorcinol/alkylpyrone synthase
MTHAPGFLLPPARLEMLRHPGKIQPQSSNQKDFSVMTPAILGLTTGVPPNQHNQTDLHDRWLAPFISSHRARAIFAAAEIDTRHSVLATADFLADEPGTQARNDLYVQAGRQLGAQVIRQALADAGLAPGDIDHLLVISCTGLDTPGLDAVLAGDLHMRQSLRRSGLIGLGCHAGLTGLDRAMLEVSAWPERQVLLLSVEFGTLHFQHGNKIDDMIAAAIFGDGAAAAVVGAGRPGHFHLLTSSTFSDTTYQDLMGFHLTDKGFRIHLSTKVAKVLRSLIFELVDDFLRQAGLSMRQIKFWGIHPGGAKIVTYIGQALGLTEADLRYSRTVLRNYGNMSSVTVFFVLNEIIRHGQPQPGDYALLLTFGPGLTIEFCLMQWQ